jgi:hypothetical protein
MLISKLLKKLQKIHAQKVIDKCVGKKYFFHFYSRSSNGFPYNILCVHLFATFAAVLKSA